MGLTRRSAYAILGPPGVPLFFGRAVVLSLYHPPMRLRFASVVFALIATAGAQSPQRVVFARVFPQPHQISVFVANADGTSEHLLVGPTEADYDPVWSPDGASIVFTSERNGSADLYRVGADGTGLERLTDSPAYDDQAAFSPDGRRLVFVTTRNGGTADLWTLDLQTKQALALTSGAGGDFRPSWSPDGRWIAFSSDRLSNFPFAHGRWERLQLANVFVIHPDGTGLKHLTAHGDFCGSPKWTADSRRVIAYCMGAEQTLDNRRSVPEHPEDTRIVAIDVESGTASDMPAGPGVKFDPSPLPHDRVGFIRKDGEQGIYYSDGTRGPAGQIRAASWSPDGTRVVFHKRVPFDRKPWVRTFSRLGGYELTLTGGGPSFSPDGERYAFVGPAHDGRGAGVAIAPVESDTVDVIYHDDSRNILGPQWSPAGDRVIFGVGSFQAFFNGFHSLFLKAEDRAEGGAQIAIVGSDGRGFRELTKGPNNNGFPSLSPDGKRFVYRTFGSEGEGLRIMNIETGAVSTLSTGYDNFPLWSPRGDQIMFARLADGFYEIFTMKPDGTAARQLTHGGGNDAHMAWSPDGSQIVFASSRMGFKDEVTYTDAPQPYGEIFVMQADGTGIEQLTDNQWEEGTPSWRPNPRATR
ncbi:MAG: TolB protein [Acidobacteriota bacterium]